ncbi:hypothetical protein Vafri_17100 [Volvox africanus]|uniref:PH domain-containing protein n=1 Tax=Volvox africanus TaxID=51714 RepID=A0A8J4BPP9_9CHLO|nr:hypothetical protein Vafri_17100 [Volvox africanus]
MVSAIIADGYLLKKKRDDRRNFLASKYQRRYFELTADTLAYAKDPRELKDGGGNIEVFAIHELKYIKKLEDCKLEFPERVLRVKAESAKQHDRWYETIKDARQKKLDGNNTPQAKQLETLKEQTKQKMMTTLEEDSDDDQPTGAVATVKKPDLQLAPLNTSQPPSVGVNNNRPQSPRSLLANPRMGTKMIAPPTRKNQHEEVEEEEEVEPLQAPKPRSRWQDEEEEEEEEVGQQQPQPQQQQKQQQQQTAQAQHRVSGANGKQATAPAEAAPPSSERLMLNANQEPSGGGGKGSAAASRGASAGIPPAAPRGEKLQLGDTSRQAAAAAAAPAAAAVQPPAKGPSRENAEKLLLGGPTAPVSGSRGNTPPTGGHARGTDIAAPIESAREEWEDDDWDSSDDDEDDKKRPAASAAATAATAGRARLSQLSTSGRPNDASDSGRPTARSSSSNSGTAAATPPVDEAAGSSRAGTRRVSGDDKGLRGTAAAAAPASAVRKSSDRGSTGQQLAPAGSEALKVVQGAPPAKGKALQPSPRQQQRQEEEEEEALAKHAAGTDHLEDNWDSEEEEEEPPRKPQGRPAPPPPVAPSPRDPAGKANPHGPQRRIPGPPPTATAAARPTPPTAAPHSLTTGIARPPTAPKQLPVGPTPSGPGTRPRGRISSEESAPPPQPPAKVAGSSGGGGSAAARHKLETSEPAPLRSNVVHDPNVKPDDNNWVEEDWDDDD